MKIIQVVPFLGLGGAEIMCENLVYELRKLGHEVIVVSLFDNKTAITQRFEEAAVDIRYLHKRDGFDFSMFIKLYALLEQEKPDVVHTHIYVTKYVFPIATMLKIKVVHTVHSVARKEASKASRIFNCIFYKYFGVVPVALSDSIKQTVQEEYHLKENKIPVVLNGIDISKCIQKENYFIDGVFKIVHVGSFLDVKNHIGMIEAFEIFHSKYGNSELHLIGDGKRRKVIEQIVHDKKLEDCVIFHGLQSNVHAYLYEMDIFTLPSLYEGVPMSIVEAMGTGLPIVATEVGGIPDMLDEDCAILVPVNVNAIAAAYEKYYLDQTLRADHGRSVLKLVNDFSSKSMAKRYLALYQK